MCVKNMQIYSLSLDRKVMTWLKQDFFAIAVKGPWMKTRLPKSRESGQEQWYNSSPKAVCGQWYPCPAWVVCDLGWGGAGQRPQRGRSPVEHRGNLSIHTYICPSVCLPSVYFGNSFCLQFFFISSSLSFLYLSFSLYFFLSFSPLSVFHMVLLRFDSTQNTIYPPSSCPRMDD